MRTILMAVSVAGLLLTGVAGASAAPPVAKIQCRSFGQTASNGGTLNIHYASPVMCWASDTTVGGVKVNDGGWVPETWFDWDWDDTSLGSVVRAGVSVNLGKSVGVVAAHAFKPTTFSESCGGGTNSLHVVRLTVSSMVGGVRESGSASVNVCVENPTKTWPTPVAYCDDDNCADDPGVPPGTVHGGKRTDLATILGRCESGGSERVVLESGVRFSTGSTGISVGGASCLIESYGGGRAQLQFTNPTSSATAIAANKPACAGYRLHNLTFAGSGGAPRLIGGGTDTGCFVILDSDVSRVPGEELTATTITDPPGNAAASEMYFIKFAYTRHGGGIAANYASANYIAYVGGEVSGINKTNPSAEHNIRLAQWNHVVIDAMRLADQQYNQQAVGGAAAKSIITLRQNCGTGDPCPNFPDARVAALTRNELVAHPGGTDPIEVCTPGTGGSASTKCYDMDFLRNALTYESSGTGNQSFIFFQGGGAAGGEIKRVRLIQNAIDTSAANASGTPYQMAQFGPATDIAAIGNVVVNTSGTSRLVAVTSAASSALDSAKDNVCYANGPVACDPFPSLPATPDNAAFATDPFNGAAGDPGKFAAFTLDDLSVGAGSPLVSTGVPSPVTTDVAGNPSPQGSATEPGLFEVAGSGGGGGGGGPTPPAAPVLLP